jgi:small subunit ribosomal protein S20
MANTKSAAKKARQDERRNAVNRARVSRIRTTVKKVEDAISTGDKAQAQAALKSAQPELHSSVNKGHMHRNTVARKLSRLTKRINAL